MKPTRLTTVLAAVSCCLAVSSARAQFITNAVTFTAIEYEQGNSSTNSNDTTTYNMIKKMYKTADLLAEINTAITTNKFSKAAKLVMIVSTDNLSNPLYAVVDGTNFYDLSLRYEIMSSGAGLPIKSGTESKASPGINPVPERTLTEVDYFSFAYADTRYFTNVNEGLRFNLYGLGTFTRSDTPTNRAGAYTETYKASITGMAGQGYIGTNFIYMSGMISAGGKEKE